MVASKDETQNGADAGAGAGADDAAKAAKAEAKKKAAEAGRAKAKKKDEGAIKIAAAGETKVSPSKTPRLKTLYQTKVVPALMKEFQYKNPMQVPRLRKITVNCAVKEAVGNPKVLDSTFDEI